MNECRKNLHTFMREGALYIPVGSLSPALPEWVSVTATLGCTVSVRFKYS
jgi:hypothetical protein